MNYIKKHPALQILIAVVFISFFAQITVELPINKDKIPITGHTFAILLIGYFLGVRKGVLAVILYLFLGGIGLPVFAEAKKGFDVLFGNSAGFFAGFIPGVALTGYFGELGWGKTFSKCFAGMVLGTLAISICAVIFLTWKYDFSIALNEGFYPYIWGAVIKTLLGATIPPIYYNLIKEE